MIALALSEIGAIAQRRIALMVDPALSFDLPPFLTPEPGLNSGLMIAEVTTAALMSENKHLANPCVTDSTPTSANQEDHVSMAAHGARRLDRMVDNLNYILGIELLCAAQGVEFRAPLATSKALHQRGWAFARRYPERLADDRYLAPELETAKSLVESGTILQAAGNAHAGAVVMQVFSVQRGDGPIVLGQPHGGTYVPDDICCATECEWAGVWRIRIGISIRLYEGLIGQCDGGSIPCPPLCDRR